MEEYIRLEEEKAQRQGRTFNRQTATFEKVENYEDEDDYFINFEAKFLAIVFDKTLTSDTTLPCEPTVYMAPLPYSDLRHPWLRYQGLTPKMRQHLAMRLRMVYAGGDRLQPFVSHAWRRLFGIQGPLVRGTRRSMTWRQFILALGLYTEEEMAQAGVGAYLSGSERFVPDKDLRDYWIEISSDRDFLGAAPSYVHTRDPVRRLCHRMIACTISGRGQGPKKVIGVDLFYLQTMDQGTANVLYLLAQYLFKHAEGRKSGARLSGGYFIRRLTKHFGLVSDEGLRGLTIISQELPMIDLHELARLNICGRLGDTWAWDAPDAAEGAQADPAPAQAPPPPPPAPQLRTMSQRIERVEKEMHLIASLSVAHGCPMRGLSELGQAMPALQQPLMQMSSPTIDLPALLS
ncbi:hypothetical protein Tco_0144587 [Tanacetum coccineum]